MKWEWGKNLHSRLGVLAGGVPLLLGQLEQLLDALLQVAVRLRHARQLLELPHLRDSASQFAPSSAQIAAHQYFIKDALPMHVQCEDFKSRKYTLHSRSQCQARPIWEESSSSPNMP